MEVCTKLARLIFPEGYYPCADVSSVITTLMEKALQSERLAVNTLQGHFRHDVTVFLFVPQNDPLTLELQRLLFIYQDHFLILADYPTSLK